MNPRPFLLDLVGKPVWIKLKWGMEYKGTDARRAGGLLALFPPPLNSATPYDPPPPPPCAGILVSTDSYMNFQVRICNMGAIRSHGARMNAAHALTPRPPAAPANMQLANSEEYIDGTHSGNLGEILIRCNNVLYVRGAGADGGTGADKAASS